MSLDTLKFVVLEPFGTRQLTNLVQLSRPKFP
jgi:hypothetical protein